MKLSQTLNKEDLIKLLDELNRPIDITSLISKGILKRKSKNRFEILKFEEIPEYAIKQVEVFEQTTNKNIIIGFSSHSIKNFK